MNYFRELHPACSGAVPGRPIQRIYVVQTHGTLNVTSILMLTFLMTLLTAVYASALHPSDYNNQGVEAYNSGQFPRAITLLEQAYNIAPDSSIVRRNLCNAYQSQANEFGLGKEFRRAIPYLERAIRVEPENFSPRVQMGSYLLNLGEVSAAIVHLEEAIRLKPGELNAHELLGQAYYMDNDLTSARAQWDYVLEMTPHRKDLQERYEKAFREESVEYDFSQWKSRHFRISYPPKVPPAIRSNVSSILDRAYIDIGRTLGGVYPPPPIHVVLYTAEQFSEATLLDGHIGAVYDGKIRSPLTDNQGQWLADEELRRRLVHEYVHVVVRHIAGDNVPWWVNEGLAETLSKSFGSLEAMRLREFYDSGAVYSLGQMESNQVLGREPGALRVAYLQSHAAIDHLWTRYGRTKMMAFLRALSTGMRGEEALQSVYRRTYANLELDIASSR